jgi:hypothetical protein
VGEAESGGNFAQLRDRAVEVAAWSTGFDLISM